MIRTLALAALVSGCMPPPVRTTTASTTDPADYPCVLHNPASLGRDFTVRQNIAIHAVHDGHPVDGELDAVLQKKGDELLIVGFGPMNVKAFTLTQRGDQIEFAQFIGPELPFSPRNVLVDVHRVLFKRLPAPAEPKYTGVQRGELDGETVEETWQGGELRGAVFTRAAMQGAVKIGLGAGCTAALCEPATATLNNEWFDYTVTITNEGYEAL